MRQLADLEIDQDETLEQIVVEDEVDVEVLLFEAKALLPGDEREPLAQFEEKGLEVLDDGLFDGRLAQGGVVLQIEKLRSRMNCSGSTAASLAMASLRTGGLRRLASRRS